MKTFITLASLSMILVSCSLTQRTTTDVANQEAPAITTQPTITQPVVAPTNDGDWIPVKETPTAVVKTYSTAEVAQNSTATSCWLILDTKIYDVIRFIHSHPGGNAILRGCWKDATQMFAKHPESAREMKEKFYIGNLAS